MSILSHRIASHLIESESHHNCKIYTEREKQTLKLICRCGMYSILYICLLLLLLLLLHAHCTQYAQNNNVSQQ